MNLKNKILIFDLDGTLVDSMGVWSDNLIRLLDAQAVVYPDDVIEKLTPLGNIGMAKYLIELGMKGTVDEIIAQIDNSVFEEYKNNIPVKSFVRETLVHLRTEGHSLNVLSASSHLMVDICLKRVGLYDMFDNVWSTDDFELKKSNPEIYRQAASKLNVSPDMCVMFDDNITALSCAKQAGMMTVGVYDDSAANFEAEMRQIGDTYIYSFAEIIK